MAASACVAHPSPVATCSYLFAPHSACLCACVLWQVVRGLVSAAQACGVLVRTGCEVASILTDPASGSVVGVQLASGEILEASIVVCNRCAESEGAG